MAAFCDNTAKNILNKELTFYECQDAIKNKTEFKKDFLLFYLNLCFDIIRTTFECLFENIEFILSAVLIYFLIVVVYRSYVNPLLYLKEFTEIGFDHIVAGPDRDRRISRAQATRRMGSKIPPPYPNGWFAVGESRELKIGGVIAVDAVGQNLCVYRGEDGIARCVDAYCPHLGANLAVGGNIRGNCIECPFHKWRFGIDGACVSVPGLERAPKGISLKHWTTVEMDGVVWIWYDAENRPPLWTVNEISEVSSWGYRGRNEFTISAHIQEIPENGSDVAHLNAVHSPSILSSLGDKYPLLSDLIGRHVWSANWNRGEDHIATLNLTHVYKLLKYNLCHVVVNVTQIGPGHARLMMHTPVGPIFISQSVTPVGPSLQRVVHRMFSPWYNAPVAALLVKSEGKMFERDILIWNSKRFVSAPAYVITDKTIKAFRSWFSQFYSSNSISFRDANQNPMDW